MALKHEVVVVSLVDHSHLTFSDRSFEIKTMSLRKLSCYKEMPMEDTESETPNAVDINQNTVEEPMGDTKSETSNVVDISRNIVEVMLTKVRETSHNCFEAGMKLRSKVSSEVLYEIRVNTNDSSCSVTGENCNWSHTRSHTTFRA